MSLLNGYALIDCNNFFVSCERVFKPHLQKKPIAILSSNDGCIISRSQELKALKVPMGAPVFQYRELFKKYDVQIFSANFTLYGDLSDRIMQIIAEFSQDLEIYSIDEAFVPIKFQKIEDFNALRAKILKWTGVPVSIGLSSTKTLAKAACFLAKKKNLSLYSLLGESSFEELSTIPVQEIWGIGENSAKILNSQGLFTATDFQRAPEHWVQKKLGLLGLRTLLELKEIPCYTPQIEDPKRKSLVYSKSFGRAITSLSELKEAVVHYTAKAACKIRNKGFLAKNFSLYLKTKEGSFFDTLTLPFSSDSTPLYIETALQLLKKRKIEAHYLKAGIYLSGLTSSKNRQLNFNEQKTDNARLMKVLDQVQARYGERGLFYAAEGLSKPWSFRRNYLSAEYTTSWKGILTIQI